MLQQFCKLENDICKNREDNHDAQMDNETIWMCSERRDDIDTKNVCIERHRDKNHSKDRDKIHLAIDLLGKQRIIRFL